MDHTDSLPRWSVPGNLPEVALPLRNFPEYTIVEGRVDKTSHVFNLKSSDDIDPSLYLAVPKRTVFHCRRGKWTDRARVCKLLPPVECLCTQRLLDAKNAFVVSGKNVNVKFAYVARHRVISRHTGPMLLAFSHPSSGCAYPCKSGAHDTQLAVVMVNVEGPYICINSNLEALDPNTISVVSGTGQGNDRYQ